MSSLNSGRLMPNHQVSKIATEKEIMHSTRHLPIIGHYRQDGISVRIFCLDANEAMDRLIEAELEAGVAVTIFDRDSSTTLYTREEIHKEAARRAASGQ